jgi:hypothetical protein
VVIGVLDELGGDVGSPHEKARQRRVGHHHPESLLGTEPIEHGEHVVDVIAEAVGRQPSACTAAPQIRCQDADVGVPEQGPGDRPPGGRATP